MLIELRNQNQTGQLISDLVVNAFRNPGEVTATLDGRITKLD